MKGTEYKVKYTASSGCDLAMPLSDGQSTFHSGIVYTIPAQADFLRLVKTGKFEIVDCDESVFDLEKLKKGQIAAKQETPKAEKPKKKFEVIEPLTKIEMEQD